MALVSMGLARRERNPRRVAAAAWAGPAPLGALVVNQLVGHLVLRPRPYGSAAAILACFMAFASVSVGDHYPGDVAGGVVIGVLVALAGWPLAVRVLEPLAARLTRSPLRPLAFARDTS